MIFRGQPYCSVNCEKALIAKVEEGRCPKCGHQKHGTVCFNMASDNDCNCTYGEPF